MVSDLQEAAITVAGSEISEVALACLPDSGDLWCYVVQLDITPSEESVRHYIL